MIVEVLCVADCPHREIALARVGAALAAEGIVADVRAIEVRDGVEAAARGFFTSPTIRIAGRDVDPGACANAAGLTCRFDVPSAEAISSVLRDRLLAEESE